MQNIEKVTQRGEKLEDLGERAGQDTHSQSLFHSVGELYLVYECCMYICVCINNSIMHGLCTVVLQGPKYCM